MQRGKLQEGENLFNEEGCTYKNLFWGRPPASLFRGAGSCHSIYFICIALQAIRSLKIITDGSHLVPTPAGAGLDAALRRARGTPAISAAALGTNGNRTEAFPMSMPYLSREDRGRWLSV